MLGLPEGGRAKDPFEVGGPLFGMGPRFGTGPRGGMRPAAGPRRPRDCVDCVGRGRRFEAATCGGGAISEGEGLDGGAMPFTVGGAGGCIEKVGGAGFDARCAEFRAGKDGGGRLSSSSLSLELWCSSSVNDGMTGAFALLAVALGVVAGDNSCSGIFSSVWPCDSSRCRLAGAPPSSSSCDRLGTVGAAGPCVGAK